MYFDKHILTSKQLSGFVLSTRFINVYNIVTKSTGFQLIAIVYRGNKVLTDRLSKKEIQIPQRKATPSPREHLDGLEKLIND